MALHLLNIPDMHDGVVINDGGELTVADGLHRLFKARELGDKTISAYVIDREDLDSIPRQMQRESSRRKSNLLI